MRGLPKFIAVLLVVALTAWVVRHVRPVFNFFDLKRWEVQHGTITRSGSTSELKITSDASGSELVARYRFPKPVSLDLRSVDAFLFRFRLLAGASERVQFELWSDADGVRKAAWPLGFQSERTGIDPTRIREWQHVRLPVFWGQDTDFDASHVAAMVIRVARNDSDNVAMELSSPMTPVGIRSPTPLFFDDPRVYNVDYSYVRQSKLPALMISIPSASLQSLEASLPQSGRTPVPAELDDERGNSHRVLVQYRGDRPIHHMYFKRSLRLEFTDSLFHGTIKRLNLIIPESYHLGTVVPYRVAASMGMMASYAYPVRVEINGMDFGTFTAVEQVDDHFIRQRNRGEGIIYYGDVSYDADVSRSAALFEEPDNLKNWEIKYVIDGAATRGMDPAEPLRRLLAAIALPQPEFEKKIGEILDIPTYIQWYVLYNVFNSMHNDSIHNAKMFFNPESGKLEMIPWDVDPNYSLFDPLPRNIANSLLSYKLFQIQPYALQRDRLYYDIIQTWFESGRLEGDITSVLDLAKQDVVHSIFTLPSVRENYDTLIADWKMGILNHAKTISDDLLHPAIEVCRYQENRIRLTIASNIRLTTSSELLSPRFQPTASPQWMVDQGIVYEKQRVAVPASYLLDADEAVVNPINGAQLYNPADPTLKPCQETS